MFGQWFMHTGIQRKGGRGSGPIKRTGSCSWTHVCRNMKKMLQRKRSSKRNGLWSGVHAHRTIKKR